MKSLIRTGVAILVASGAAIAAADTTQTATSTPKLLINFKARTGTQVGSATADSKANLTADESGWYNWHQDNEPSVPGRQSSNNSTTVGDNHSGKYLNTNGVCESTVEGAKFKYNGGNGNFRSEWGVPSGKQFESGAYTNVFGQEQSTIIDEVRTSLSLPDATTFSSNVWDAGIGNGGEQVNNAEIAGLDATKKYIVYVGIGRQVQNKTTTFPEAYGGFKLANGGYGTITKLEYVVTKGLDRAAGGINTVKATHYTPFAATTRVGPDKGELMIVRYVGKPNASGKIEFTTGGADNKENGNDEIRPGLTFVAVAELVEPSVSYTASPSSGTDINWSTLSWTPAKPETGFAENSKLTVNLPENGTLVFDELVNLPECTVTIAGTTGVKFKAADTLFTDGCYEKAILSCGSFVTNSATTAELKDGFKGAYNVTATGFSLRAQNKEVISVNFSGGYPSGAAEQDSEANCIIGAETEELFGLAPVPGKSWIEIKKRWNGGSKTFTNETYTAYDGTTVQTRAALRISATAANTYHETSINNKFLRGYLDDSTPGLNVVVEGVPYASYDLILYATSDTALQLAPMGVNGTKYRWDSATGATVVTTGNNGWGVGEYGTPEFGKNALLVTNLTGTSFTIAMTRQSGDNTPRATLAAIQIINRGGDPATQQIFTHTVEPGTNTLALTNATYNTTFAEGLLNEVHLTVNGEATDEEFVLTIDQPSVLLERIKITAPNGRKVKIVADSEVANVANIEFNTVTEVTEHFKKNIVVVSPGKFKYVVSEDKEYPFGPVKGTGDAILGAVTGKTLTIKKNKAAEYTFGKVEIPSGTVKIGTTAQDASFKFAATELGITNATFDIGSRDSIDGVRNIVASNACLTTGAFLMIPTVTLADSRIELTGGYAEGWKNWCMNGKLSAYGNSSIKKMPNANGHTSIHLMNGEFWVAEGATLTLNVPMVDKPSDRNGSLHNQIKKSGPGTMIIEDNPTDAYYSGFTTVAEGTLVYHENRASTTANQNFKVAANATLAGNAYIRGNAKVILEGANAVAAGSLQIANLEVVEGASLGSATAPITNLTVTAALTANGEATPTLKVINGTASVANATVASGVKFNVTKNGGDNDAGILDIGTNRTFTISGNGALRVNLTTAESKQPRVELFNIENSQSKELTIDKLTVGEKEFTHNSRGLIYSENKGILKVWIRGVMLLFGHIGL